jgi:hypothetical protein
VVIKKEQNYLSTYTNINSKLIEDLTIRFTTMKLLGKNGKHISGHWMGKDFFLGNTPETETPQVKIDK